MVDMMLVFMSMTLTVNPFNGCDLNNSDSTKSNMYKNSTIQYGQDKPWSQISVGYPVGHWEYHPKYWDRIVLPLFQHPDWYALGHSWSPMLGWGGIVVSYSIDKLGQPHPMGFKALIQVFYICHNLLDCMLNSLESLLFLSEKLRLHNYINFYRICHDKQHDSLNESSMC